MKKSIVLISLFVFTVSVGFAQKKFSFGFDVAPHLNWVSSNTKRVKNDGASMGVKYGLGGDFFFAKNYAIRLGMMFNHTNYNLLYNDTIDFETTDDFYSLDSMTSVNYHTQYLDIPFSVKFRSNEIGYFTILFEGGFVPGIAIKRRGSIDDYDVSKETLSDETNLVNLSYYFEGGAEYSVGAQLAIKGAVYYSSGILDITNDSHHSDDRITMNSAGLKIGLVF